MGVLKYPEYKDSGVEWLGDVPSHWDLDRFKWSTSDCRNGIWGSEAQGDENDIPCIRVADFDRNYLRVSDQIPTIRSISASERTGRLVQSGDLLLEKSGGGENQPVGFVALYEGAADAVCSNFVARMKLSDKQDASYWRYAHHAAYAVRLNTRSIKQTSGIQNLDQHQYLDEVAPFPPHDEQQAIANFLDRETSKIDALVSEQRRLIELLKEKRQAVISHAVTKGLNPNAPTKPSNIPWLGDVPEHWEIRRLGHMGRTTNGLSIGGEAFGSGHPFVSYGDVYNNANVPNTPSGLVQSSKNDQQKCGLLKGDVLFTRTSETADDIGIASTCLDTIPYSTFAGFLIRFRPFEGLLEPRYSTFLFRNQGVQNHFAGTMNLVTRASLSQDVLQMLPLCIPPLQEQQDIAEYLVEQEKLFQDLTTDIERSIILMQERRTALISAAVTGKVDVRNAVPEAASA